MDMNPIAKVRQLSRLVFSFALGLVIMPTLLVLLSLNVTSAHNSGSIENQALSLLTAISLASLVAITLAVVVTRAINVYYDSRVRQELNYARVYENVKHEIEWQTLLFRHRGSPRPWVPPTEIDLTQTYIVPFRPLKRRVARTSDPVAASKP